MSYVWDPQNSQDETQSGANDKQNHRAAKANQELRAYGSNMYILEKSHTKYFVLHEIFWIRHHEVGARRIVPPMIISKHLTVINYFPARAL
jgi:hypothetical protein